MHNRIDERSQCRAARSRLRLSGHSSMIALIGLILGVEPGSRRCRQHVNPVIDVRYGFSQSLRLCSPERSLPCLQHVTCSICGWCPPLSGLPTARCSMLCRCSCLSGLGCVSGTRGHSRLWEWLADFPAHFSQNFGWTTLAPVLGGNAFNLLFGKSRLWIRTRIIPTTSQVGFTIRTRWGRSGPQSTPRTGLRLRMTACLSGHRARRLSRARAALMLLLGTLRPLRRGCSL